MKRVIIIGAGPAGLTAGYELLKQTADYEVILLEEGETPGGISRTVRCDGNAMDLGGHRFFSKDERIQKWWEEMLPLQGSLAWDDKKLGRKVTLEQGGPDPEKEDRVFLKRKRISRIYYRNHFFDYPVKINFTTLKNLGLLTTLQAGLSYGKASLFKRREQSLEDFYVNRFGKKLYHIFFEGYTEKLWGQHPARLSPAWGAQRVKGLSLLAVLRESLSRYLPVRNRNVETSLIDTFYYPKYGAGQMWEETAARLEQLGGKICYGCKVTGLEKDGHRVKILHYLEKGEQKTMEADAVFSSMPIADLLESMNQVPEEIRNIGRGLPYRALVTVGLLVDRLLIQNTTAYPTLGNIVPDCWIYVQDNKVKMGRIQIFNNWSPYMVKEPEHTLWLGLEYFCREGDELWSMPDEKWRQLAQKELIQMGILDEKTPIRAAHCERVPKAYPAYFQTYQEFPVVETWLNSIENLYCIGRNGQHRYNNMDHSMLTAMEAVHAFLNPGADKTKIWKVNTEQEYHEQRRK